VPALTERALDDRFFDVAREGARAVARIDSGVAHEQARRTGSVHLREASDLAAIR
jgi:hypothetical protein